MDTRDIVERLRSGEVAFLTSLDIESVEPSVGYVLGRALESQGMRESAGRAYQRVLDLRETPDDLKALSASRLAAIAVRRNDWSAARVHAALGLEYGPALGDLWFEYGRGLYEAEEYQDLREWIPQAPPGEDLLWERHSSSAFNGELLLWNAVASIELDQPGTEDVLRLFTTLPADEVHRRVYLYLFYGDHLGRFSREQTLLIEAVYRVSIQEYDEALRLFSRIDVAGLGPRLLRPEADALGLHRTVERAIAGAGTYPRPWFDQLRAEIPPTDHEGFAVATGRMALLRAAAGERDAMDDLIEASARLAQGDPDLAAELSARRRALETSLELPIEIVIEHARDLGEDAPVFDQILEPRLPGLIRDRRWDRLATIRSELPREAEVARAKLAMVLVAADQWSQLVGGDVAEALAPLAELPPTDYYGLVARRLLGQSMGTLDDGGTTGPDVVSAPAPAAESLQHTLIRALFDAGLVDESYRIAMDRARTPALAGDSLDMARLYAEYGYVSQALGLARRAVVRGELSPGRTEIEILYPRPFSGEFTALSERFGIDRALFYGLVREESHFNPRARSPVGAEGLAQLMPATAEDMLRRMRLETFDVFHPSDNLAVGAYHLAYLSGEILSPVLRVAAYNAGLGRGRAWTEGFGDLPPLLQLEAVPFSETRWYLRRIAVSAAWYGWLLEGINPVRGLDILLLGGLR